MFTEGHVSGGASWTGRTPGLSRREQLEWDKLNPIDQVCAGGTRWPTSNWASGVDTGEAHRSAFVGVS